MKRATWLKGAIALGATCAGSVAFAADHLDSPAAMADPSADITDTYTWMDGGNVVLVLDVTPLADQAAKFSDQVQYVFHTASGATFGATTKSLDVICTFDATQKISCWAGDKDYVTGDASADAGLVSASGKMKVFAGLRDDPFFFNLDGFKHTVSTVDSAAPSLMFDGAGCPALDQATASLLVGQLQHDANGGPPVDFFGGKNVLSIVVSIDKTLLTDGGPVVSMWASTNKAGG